MSEQSIRDELASELYETDGRYSWTWDELVAGWERGQKNGLDPNYPHLVRAFRAKADLILISPAIRRIQAGTWGEGYESGYDDRLFEERGMPTDSDADEHPHSNPYIERGEHSCPAAKN